MREIRLSSLCPMNTLDFEGCVCESYLLFLSALPLILNTLTNKKFCRIYIKFDIGSEIDRVALSVIFPLVLGV